MFNNQSNELVVAIETPPNNKKSRIYGTSDLSIYLSAMLKLESAPASASASPPASPTASPPASPLYSEALIGSDRSYDSCIGSRIRSLEISNFWQQ